MVNVTSSYDSGVDGTIILKWILRSRMGGMYWIVLIQNRHMWRVLVKAVMNLCVP